jgi:cyanophycin synthetase
MKITDIAFLEGRNIYSHRPVIKIRLDPGEWRDFRTSRHPRLVEKLIRLLPGLADHNCSRGCPGGFLERLAEGTYPGHVVEHVFLELQERAGLGTTYGKTISVPGGQVDIICEYRCREAAEYLAGAAVSLVGSLLAGKEENPAAAVEQAKKLADHYMPGPSTGSILKAARRRGIPVAQLAPGTSLYRLGNGKYQKRIEASTSGHTGSIAVDIASNKQLTKKLLSIQGLPVPCGEVARTVDEAVRIAENLGFPVALKPENGNQGKGVSLNINSGEELELAFKQAAAFSDRVIVEKYLHGRHYRLLVIGGELAAAAERIPAHVMGDGSRTVRELIEKTNLDPLRGTGHEKPLTRIVVDDITGIVLSKQGLTLDSVADRGQCVYLRESANLSTGGIACDVTGLVHPLQAEMAVMAAGIVGLDIAGVDMVMADIARHPEGQEGGIIEVNAAPGLRMHLFPTVGQGRAVGEKIVDMLFPPSLPCRVPVISVTGTNGKTTTTRMIDYVLRRYGLHTGMCCTDGVYIGGRKIMEGDLTGPGGAACVMGHPRVEAAVLETARGGIIRRGLGYDRADVAVVTNIRNDHLGQDGIDTLEDLFYVKSLVAEAVYPGGAAVLNADDSLACELANRVYTEKVFTSMKNENIVVRRHLGAGGRAVFVRRGTIIAAQGYRAVIVGRTRDFPVTLGGKAGHLVENLLLALAACWGHGIPPRQAGFFLRRFGEHPEDNPGRAALYSVKNYRVLVDYGHNPDGFAKTGELARKLRSRRIIAVVGMPGDREDRLIIEAGRTAGAYFDDVVVKEDDDLRGRKPGEVAELLVRGAMEAGLPGKKITVVNVEHEAVKCALSMAGERDLVVIFFEKLEHVLTELKNRNAGAVTFATAPLSPRGEKTESPASGSEAGITGVRGE